MNFNLLHPREQIVKTMQRIYDFGMTTTSGGNISVIDEYGDIWISPSAVDKGTLKPEDIVMVDKKGQSFGLHKPSSEYPFHQAIYKQRPDIKAIVHAHPPALVSFSIVRQVPDTTVIPQANHVCGKVGYAKYKLPGSEALGKSIANTFKEGYNCVLMENHGTVVGGEDLSHAFQKFETLEFCARSIMEGFAIGNIKTLNTQKLEMFSKPRSDMKDFQATGMNIREKELRGILCDIIKRAYRQRLIISTYGTFSTRLSANDFVITPYGKDRYYLEREDLVVVRNGQYEKGKTPSRSVVLHQNIYKSHPGINCVITAQSPFAMAYAITGRTFDTRTIPESYILLREIPLIPYGDQFATGQLISSTLGKDTPILLIENDSILVTGKSVLETFDRLEVAEFSARSLTQSVTIGKMVPIEDQEIEDIKKKFIQ